MSEKPAEQNEELLKQGADLLADIFVEQIVRKHSQPQDTSLGEMIRSNLKIKKNYYDN